MSWMKKALWCAKRALRCQEVPVGCVIVYKGRMIARAHNAMRRLNNPFAHAEMLAVLQAQKKLSPYLSECSLYVTLEPCDLCYAMLRRCRLHSVYFGAYETAFLKKEKDLPMMGGFCEQESQKLLSDFFRERR